MIILQNLARFVDYLLTNPQTKLLPLLLKATDIEDGITRFKNNETQISISTTIIEVGVNISNATVMVIKGSERFGLAQTHQLRVRVGRSDLQPYCFLQPEDPNDVKAGILQSTSDGFEIAKVDLKMRDTGDFIGTSQSGYNPCTDLMVKNPPLYKKISE